MISIQRKDLQSVQKFILKQTSLQRQVRTTGQIPQSAWGSESKTILVVQSALCVDSRKTRSTYLASSGGGLGCAWQTVQNSVDILGHWTQFFSCPRRTWSVGFEKLFSSNRCCILVLTVSTSWSTHNMELSQFLACCPLWQRSGEEEKAFLQEPSQML